MFFFWFLSGLDLYCGRDVEMMKITWAPRRLQSTSAHLRGINRQRSRARGHSRITFELEAMPGQPKGFSSRSKGCD